MMKVQKTLLLGMLFGVLSQNLSQAAESPITIDGKLDEKEWQSASVETGFRPLASRVQGTVAAPFKTSFRWFAGKEALYLAVECEEPAMSEMKVVPRKSFSADVFKSDAIEVFIDPTGKGADYYQFVVNTGGDKYHRYMIEGGNTTGGEYGGEWDAAVSLGKSGWTVEMRIPYAAFYLTPASQFSTDWKFNIARDHYVGGRDVFTFTSWSPLNKKFHEPANFKTISGLPRKDPAMDVMVEGGKVEISHKDEKQYSAETTLYIQNDSEPLDEARVEVQIGGKVAGSRMAALPKGKTVLKVSDIALENPGTGTLDVAISNKEGQVLHRRFLTYRAEYEPISVTFTEPFYGACIFPGQTVSEGRATARVQLPVKDLEGAVLEVASEAGTGEAWKQEFPISADRMAEILIPGTAIQEGENIYRLRVVKNDREIVSGQTLLRKLPLPESGNTVYIDRDLNLVINRKPTFMLGFMGGNLPMAYGLSLAQQLEYGWKGSSRFLTPDAMPGWMYVSPERLLRTDSDDFLQDIEPSEEMYATVLKRMEEIRKSNPSGLFYYLADEPECRAISPVYLQHLYRFIKKHDPYHPVLIVTRSPELFTGCADILSSHPYPDPQLLPDGTRTMNPIRRYADMVGKVLKAGNGKIAPWTTPQTHSYSVVNNRSVQPTFDEFQCVAYTSVVAGAKGLIPFMYSTTLGSPDLRLGYDFVYESLFMLEPYLLERFPGLPVKVESEGDAVLALLQKHKDNYALLTVNVTPKPAKANLELPKETAKQIWYGFRNSEVLPPREHWNLEYAPHEVKVFTTDKTLSKNLKSETQFRLELEEARKQLKTPGNILANRGQEIVWDASHIWPRNKDIMKRALPTLCDGEKLAVGYRAGRTGEVESLTMGFPQDPVRFQKVRVYGENIAKLRCRYMKKNQWQDAGEVEWKPDYPSVEIALPEAVSSDKVQVELVPRDQDTELEVYEVEMFQ